MRGVRTHRGSFSAVGCAPDRLPANERCGGEVRRLYVRHRGGREHVAVGYACHGCGAIAVDLAQIPHRAGRA